MNCGEVAKCTPPSSLAVSDGELSGLSTQVARSYLELLDNYITLCCLSIIFIYSLYVLSCCRYSFVHPRYAKELAQRHNDSSQT